jgi:GT2 family glycosyltransferase
MTAPFVWQVYDDRQIAYRPFIRLRANTRFSKVSMARLTISLVTYNSAAVIADCLRSIPTDVPVMVLDNASTDNTIDIVHQARPSAQIIAPGKNLGFGNAHNFNLQNMDTEFGLVLNPDTILLPRCLDELIATADSDKQAGMIGAQHVHPDGTPYSCFGNDTLYHPQITTIPEKKALSVTADDVICVETIVGALMLIRRSAFPNNIYFDPNIFMYFEDIDICAQTRMRGQTVLLNPRARVIHLQDKSSPPTLQIARLKGFASQFGKLYVYKKYHPHLVEFLPYAAWSLKKILSRLLKAALRGDGYELHRYAAGLLGWGKGLVS